MNTGEIKKVVDSFDSQKTGAKEVNEWIKELRARASGTETHYRGEIDFRFANEMKLPDPGFIGNPDGYSVTMDIRKRHQFQTEYMSMNQMLASLGYSRLATNESIDPSAVSNLMTIFLDKKKALEDRVMQLLGNINTVLKSVIAITYELKELDRNLSFYKLSKAGEKEKAEAAELALKRIFLDNVDARKGGASLSSLSRSSTQAQGGGPGFIDIVAAFYQVKSLKAISDLQRNEQYKNILKNRYIEYEDWKKINGEDLKNRKNMLLQYLKSQVSSFNMYTEWAAQYMTIMNRIRIERIKGGKELVSSNAPADIFETAMFKINMIGYKQMYLREYDIEHKKLFGERGPEIVKDAALKTIGPRGTLMTRGHKEDNRSFIYKHIKKYGPVVVTAVDTSFGFREKQAFLPELPQPPNAQYEGTFFLTITPLCFTLDEWFVYKKALEAYSNKTVFAGVDQAVYHSLDIIKKDLDKYITEADEAEKDKGPKKKQNDMALSDIYRSFRDDFFGISKSLSQLGEPIKKGAAAPFNKELYEIVINKKFHKTNHKDAIEAGLFVANKEAEGMYNEFKRRSKLLNNLSPFTIY